MATLKYKGLNRRPGQRPSFEVKRDSVTVTVSFRPMRVSGRWYESWMVDYYHHGQRIRRRQEACGK